jgi:hypothetical protein
MREAVMIEKVKEYRDEMRKRLGDHRSKVDYVDGYRTGFFDALDEVIELLENEEAKEVQTAVDWMYKHLQK